MQVKKESYSYLDIPDRLKLEDFGRWRGIKQKNSIQLDRLKEQNESLLRGKNLLLQQDKHLRDYTQACLLRELSRSRQLLQYIRNYQIYRSTGKRHSANSLTRKYQIQQNRYGGPTSARKHQQVAASILGSKFQFVSNFRPVSVPKCQRKKFSYLNEDQLEVNRVVSGSISKKHLIPKQQQQLKEKDYHKAVKQNNISCKDKESNVRKQNISIEKEQHGSRISPQSTKNITIDPKVQQLQRQVQQLKQVQSKLLDRIQERDDIIQQLQQIIAQYRQQPKSQEKQHDKDTIDSTYTPKKFPY